MKSTITTIMLILTFLYPCGAQILERNEVDEFTGNKIQKTSYEVLVQNFKMTAYIAATSINDSTAFLDLKLTIGPGRVHSIDRDAVFFLKLADNSIVELRNREYALSCTGCGSKGFIGSGGQGSKTVYPLSKSQITKLKAAIVSKIRIYTNGGYLESDVNDNRCDVVRRSLNLLSLR